MEQGTARASYWETVRRSRICVYSRGLRNSPAFKLGEYLASGRCILAEEPDTRLPRPLRDGEEVLFFRTADELVDRCRALLADERLQRHLAAGARAYYEAEVRPRERVREFLRLAFDGNGTDRPEEVPASLASADG